MSANIPPGRSTLGEVVIWGLLTFFLVIVVVYFLAMGHYLGAGLAGFGTLLVGSLLAWTLRGGLRPMTRFERFEFKHLALSLSVFWAGPAFLFAGREVFLLYWRTAPPCIVALFLGWAGLNLYLFRYRRGRAESRQAYKERMGFFEEEEQ